MNELAEAPAEVAIIEEPQPKVRKWAYYADIAKWIIGTVGVVIDHIKNNPFPKKDAYQTV